MRYRKTLRTLESDLQLIEEKYSVVDQNENAFVLAADEARDKGQKEFEFPKGSGKMHPVTIKADIEEEIEQKNENLEESDLNEKKKRKRTKKKRKRKRTKLTRGYKANRSKSSQNKLKKLIDRFNKAKKTPGKSDDLAAIKARDEFEKTQVNTGKQSKHNYAEGLDPQMMISEDEQRSIVSGLIEEMADDLFERSKISDKVHKALKKKAKDRNAPLGALKAIYRKGMGAFYSSGSRSGQNPHSWAMARVNSVLKGGKARSVDSAQWKQIQKHRKKKRKK